MKILFISQTNPFEEPKNGSAQRTILFLQALSKISNIDVIVFQDNCESNLPNVQVVFSHSIYNHIQKITKQEKWSVLLKLHNPQALFPINKEKEKIIDDIIRENKYDYIVTRYLTNALPWGLLKYRKKLIIDCDDSLSFYFQQLSINAKSASSHIRNKIASWEAPLITRLAISGMKHVFFSNKKDVHYGNASFLPNIPYYNNITPCEPVNFIIIPQRILFVGELDYEPNQIGISHFLDKIYIPLQKILPNVELQLVGRLKNDSLKEKWLQYHNVHITGFVEHLKNEYANSRVVIVPIYHCGGTNIKILEALQMGRACVCTSYAAKSFSDYFIHSQDIYSSKNDKLFIESLISLLTDESENRRISANGLTKIAQYFSQDSFNQIVSESLLL